MKVVKEEYPLQPGFNVGEKVLMYRGQLGYMLGIVTQVDKHGSIWGWKTAELSEHPKT